jgi:hypothetical protein
MDPAWWRAGGDRATETERMDGGLISLPEWANMCHIHIYLIYTYIQPFCTPVYNIVQIRNTPQTN